MAEFPALPLWTDAYLGDTTHLNVTEHGAYLLLLMTAWRTADCSLPDDDKLLARYARCEPRQWKKLREIIEPFFVVENGRWRQLRLNDERELIEAKRQKAAENGRASALKRKGRHSAKRDKSDSAAKAERQQSENLTTTTPNSVDKSTGAERAENDPESESFDPVKALFDDGIRCLGNAGTSEKSARSLIGRWRRDHGDGAVALAIAAAESRNISQPVEWISKWLCARANDRPDNRASKEYDLVESILAEHGRKPP